MTSFDIKGLNGNFYFLAWSGYSGWNASFPDSIIMVKKWIHQNRSSIFSDQ